MDKRMTDISDPSGLIPADDCVNLYRELFGSMYDGVLVFERCGSKFRALYMNERLFEVAGYSKEQFHPYFGNISVFLFEDDERRIFELAEKCEEDGVPFSCEVRGYRYDGSVAWYVMRVSRADFIKSENPVFFSTINDITSVKELQHRFRINVEKGRILEETNSFFMFEYSNVADKMTFFPPDKSGETRVIENYTTYLRRSDRILEEDVVYYVDALVRACRKEVRGHVDVRSRSADNTGYVLSRVHYSSISDDYGTILTIVGRIEELGKAEDMENKPDTIREKDGFACLPDSYSCIKKIKSIISETEGRCYMALVDVDEFTRFNREYGSDTANKALETIASYIASSFGENAVAFRYNGEDEFIVFTRGCSDSDMYDMSETLRDKCMETDFSLRGDNKPLTLSIGAAWAERHDKLNIKDFYVTAGRALFMAKLEGKDRVYLKKIIF